MGQHVGELQLLEVQAQALVRTRCGSGWRGVGHRRRGRVVRCAIGALLPGRASQSGGGV